MSHCSSANESPGRFNIKTIFIVMGIPIIFLFRVKNENMKLWKRLTNIEMWPKAHNISVHWHFQRSLSVGPVFIPHLALNDSDTVTLAWHLGF